MARIRYFGPAASNGLFGSGRYALVYDVDPPVSRTSTRIAFDLTTGLQVVITGSNLLTAAGRVTKIDLVESATSTVVSTIDQLGAGLAVGLFTTADPGREQAIFGNPNTYFGTNGTDSIFAGGSPDIINGLGGDDDLIGAAGNDVLNLGDGTDRGSGHAGIDVINGGEGDDDLYGDFFEDIGFRGVAGADRLNGGNGDDFLFGGEKADILNGGAGNDGLTPFHRFETGDVLDGGPDEDVASISLNFDPLDPRDVLARSFNFSAIHTAAGALTGGMRIRNTERVTFEGAAGIDTVIGSIGNDIIAGFAGADILRGGPGDDQLFANRRFGASSTTSGQADADELNGGAGSDTAVIAYGAQTQGRQISFAGLGPASNLTLADGKKLIGIEHVQLIAGTGNDTVVGGAGNDTVDGNLGSDILRGGAGDDVLAAVFRGTGNQLGPPANPTIDRIDGGDGFDQTWIALDYTDTLASYDFRNLRGATPVSIKLSANVSILASNIERVVADAGQSGRSTISMIGIEQTGASAALGDRLAGTFAGDRLFGLSGDDELEGRAGDDRLDGGAGADNMRGSTGDDFYFVDNVADRAVEFESQFGPEGFDTVQSRVSYVLLSFVDKLILTGTANLTGTGNDIANEILGTRGNNVLAGLAGDDKLAGGLGNDILNGGAGFDVADYSAAASVVSLATTAAQRTGALGSDRVVGIEGLLGSAGADRFTGTAFANTLSGQSGHDQLFGVGGNDTLTGGFGNDVLNGGAGADLADFSGANVNIAVSLLLTRAQATGHGSDVFVGIDNLSGGLRNDRFIGNNFANVLGGGAGNDGLSALGGNDVINGGDGNDTLSGGAGNDTINAGADTDRIEGGLGTDILSGGGEEGSPTATFVYRTVADSRPGPLSDRILDFFSSFGDQQLNDKIDLSAIDADTTVAGNQAFKLVGGFSGAAGEVLFIPEGTTSDGQTLVQAEVNGQTGLDFEIFLKGFQDLGGSFIL